MRTKFSTSAVKKRNLRMTRVVSEYRTTEQTIIERHTDIDKRLTVPRYAAYNPSMVYKSISTCYRKKSPHAATIILLILTQLQEAKQNNEIVLMQTEVSEYLGISIGTVNKAFQVLEELTIITKLANSKYKVSPELAWVGTHVEWAEQLLAIKDNIILGKLEVTEMSVEDL